MIINQLASYIDQMRRASLPADVLSEAKRRVLDTVGCFYGAYDTKPVRLLRETLASRVSGDCLLWGTPLLVPAETAAWVNGTSVRALDYNDTYLSLEPCHPSDLIASIWAASELSGSKAQGSLLIKGLVLGYDVLCRLCDAASIRVKGWDHVTYLPIASAAACSFVLGLSSREAQHAIALALTGHVALRQTRVGTISDWKAACAAYAARAGLWASQLAKRGFTGPSEAFHGRHGFFKQVSGGPFALSQKPLGRPWSLLKTHVKYFPAEHHAQSAIEAALLIKPRIKGQRLERIFIECFDVGVAIIGSEKEKWAPATRETADHSMPYLVVAALLDGHVTLKQYERKRFLKADVRRLMKKVQVKTSKTYTALYPKQMPTRVTVTLSDGRQLSQEILRPQGYAGRPLTQKEREEKFLALSNACLTSFQQRALIQRINRLETVSRLKDLARTMAITQSVYKKGRG